MGSKISINSFALLLCPLTKIKFMFWAYMSRFSHPFWISGRISGSELRGVRNFTLIRQHTKSNWKRKIIIIIIIII